MTGAHLTGIALAFDPLMPVYTVAAPIPTDFIVAAHDQGIADAKAALAAFEAIGKRGGNHHRRPARRIDHRRLLQRHSECDPHRPRGRRAERSRTRQRAAPRRADRGAPLPGRAADAARPLSGARASFSADKVVIAWNGSAAGGPRGPRGPAAARHGEVGAGGDRRRRRAAGRPGAGRRHRHLSRPPRPRRRRCGPSPTPTRAPARRSSASPPKQARLDGDGRLRPQPHPRVPARRRDAPRARPARRSRCSWRIDGRRIAEIRSTGTGHPQQTCGEDDREAERLFEENGAPEPSEDGPARAAAGVEQRQQPEPVEGGDEHHRQK